MSLAGIDNLAPQYDPSKPLPVYFGPDFISPDESWPRDSARENEVTRMQRAPLPNGAVWPHITWLLPVIAMLIYLVWYVVK